jgi:hypothetical protein
MFLTLLIADRAKIACVITAAARRRTDGIADPRKARAIRTLSLQTARHASTPETRFGVMRK